MGIPRGLRDFQAEWESRFLTFPLRGFPTAFRAAIFSAPYHAALSWAISTGNFLEQRHLPGLAPRAHLAIVLPPGMVVRAMAGAESPTEKESATSKINPSATRGGLNTRRAILSVMRMFRQLAFCAYTNARISFVLT